MMNFRNTKGASETLGFVLIIGLTIGSSIIMLGQVGQPIQQLETTAETQVIENELLQLASYQSEVGYSENQASINNTKLTELTAVDSSEMSIYTVDEDGNTNSLLYQIQLSGYTYETEENIYYIESGGVFKVPNSNEINYENMSAVTQPSINYTENTLTLPIITSSNTDGRVFSPNYTLQNDGFDRLDTQYLPSDQIKVVVEGETYSAWGNSFEEKTDGEATFNHQENTSEIILGQQTTHPSNVSETVISGSSLAVNGGAQINGNITANSVSGEQNISGTTNTEATSPPNINTYITEKQNDIKENGEQIEITNTDTVTAGTYYTDSIQLDGGTTVFDASSGSIDLVVTDRVEITNSAQVKIQNTSEERQVNIYLVDSAYTVENGSPKITVGSGDLTHHVVYGTTDSEFKVSQNGSWNGVYYAPKTETTGSSNKTSTNNGKGNNGKGNNGKGNNGKGNNGKGNNGKGNNGNRGGGANCKNTNYDVCVGANATVNGTVVGGKTIVGQSSTLNIDESVYEFEPVTEDLNNTDTPKLIYLNISESKIKLTE